MPEPIHTYTTRVTGLWTTRHTILGPEGPLGVLTCERDGRGVVRLGTWRPVKGEVLHLRRDPGLLRSQFSLWTEGREWLGSSLRWSFVAREIALSTGNKPLRLVPIPGFGRGWRLHAPKTGEMARIEPAGLGRGSILRVYRRIDFELVVFAYFLGALSYADSFWPGREVVDDLESLPSTPSKA